jgi:dihydrofolate synthase/folylpolyglutamate synthase
VNYPEAYQYLLSLQTRGIKLDLDRMRGALAALGSPETSYPVVLVAGTNGKGSTASALASILHRPGRKVGLFTSPHLVDYRERIRLNGRKISASALADRITADREVFDRFELTFFETSAALGFTCFREAEVDVAVVEIGLGGRLDATNVCEPVLSVVTSIGRDHVHILGDDLSQIAQEKAGILRAGRPAVLAGGFARATSTLHRHAAAISAPIFSRPNCLKVHLKAVPRPGEGTTKFTLERRETAPPAVGLPASLDLEITPPGVHQVANASLAALAASIEHDGFSPATPEEIQVGLARWRWPGRLDRPRPDLPILFDAGHNRQAGAFVASSLARIAGERPIRLVAGMLAKKDHFGYFSHLRTLTDEVRMAPPQTPRAADRDELREAAERAGFRVIDCPSIAAAIEAAADGAYDPDGPLVAVVGSLFVLEEGYRYLGVEPLESLWSGREDS